MCNSQMNISEVWGTAMVTAFGEDGPHKPRKGVDVGIVFSYNY
jgi:hypothetical protein